MGCKRGGWFSNPKSLLQDVHFTVEPGQFVGVVGPNGAGKTTLLKALVGERPAHGRILFQMGDTEYEDLYDNPEYWLKKIGYVPVDNVLHDDLTVLQALMHVGRLRLPDIDEARILERVQLRLGRTTAFQNATTQ